MFDLRFNRIQVAITDGRLDEACELMKDPSVRAHRAGQRLLTQLVKAYVRRGQEHLAAERIAPALDDCNRAEKLGGNMPAVMELRAAVCGAIEARQLASRQNAQQLEQGRRQLQNGWLSAGQKILSDAEDKQAQVLLEEARFRKTATDEAIGRIEKALGQDDVELAARIFHEQGLGRILDEKAGALLKRIRDRACRQIREDMEEGRIQQAAAILNRLPESVLAGSDLQSARQGIAYCRQAADLIETGCFGEALLPMRKALSLIPKAQWLRRGLEQVQKAAQVQADVQAGPLGLLEIPGRNGPERAEKFFPMQYNTAGQDPKNSPVMTMESKNEVFSGLPQMFVLQLDGIGAYLVHRGRQVTAGPVSSKARPDLGFIAAPDAGIKQIERLDGDYFVCDSKVGPQPGNGCRRLLGEGDKIEISPRCRMKFSRPNAASGTACLVLSGARLPRADVQQVVLMDREILIGPGRNCHIQTGQIDQTVMLFIRDGRLLQRTEEEGVNAVREVGVNQRVQIGAASGIITPYPG